MTNLERKAIGIPSLLEKVTRRFEAIADAADSCRKNFFWLHIDKSKWIPFLDTDVICGVLPSISLARHAYQLLEGAEKLDFTYLLGPHSVRNCLRTIEHFCIPPGSVGELIVQKERITGRMTNNAKTFFEILDSARNAPDPAAAVLSQSSGRLKLGQLLRDNLESFSARVDDISLLDQLIEQSTPLQFLIESGNVQNTGKAFRQTYDYLKGFRPDYSKNNLCDAINIETVVRVFNSQSELSRGRSLPLLITATDVLLRFENALYPLLRPSHQTLLIIRSSLYLLMTEGLQRHTEGRYGVMASEASMVAEGASALANLCKSILLWISIHVPKEKSENLRMEDLPAEPLDKLFLKTKDFAIRWRFLFEQQRENLGHDRTLYLNELFDPEIDRQLNSAQKDDIRLGLERLEERLRDFTHPYYDLWRLLLKHHAQSVRSNIPQRIFLNYNHFVVRNDGRPLTEISVNEMLGESAVVQGLSEIHDFRAVAQCEAFTGVFLAVDSWKNEKQRLRTVGVCWQHHSDAKVLWNIGVQLLMAARVIDMEYETVQYMFVVDGVVHRGFYPIGKALISLSSDLRQRLSHSEYCEIFIANVCVYFDLSPYLYHEQQVGITLSDSDWTRGLLNRLVDSISKTSKFPFEPRQCSETLTKLTSMLRLIERN